jgi:hypothetical protein
VEDGSPGTRLIGGWGIPLPGCGRTEDCVLAALAGAIGRIRGRRADGGGVEFVVVELRMVEIVSALVEGHGVPPSWHSSTAAPVLV